MVNAVKDYSGYKRLNIQHIAFAKPSDQEEVRALEKHGVGNLDALPEIIPSVTVSATPAFDMASPAMKVLARRDMTGTLVAELNKNVVRIAPTAAVYPIPQSQPDLSPLIKNTLAYFDYYMVKWGLCVLPNREDRITELLFEVGLESDAPEKTFVTAYDMMPNDTYKDSRIISGKVSLGLSNLLKFIPSPAAQAASEIIKIDIEPMDINWNIRRYKVAAAGNLDYKLYWKVYDAIIANDFEPAAILKVKKGVNRVHADVKVIYTLKTGWLTTEIKTKKARVPILPL